MSRRSLGACAIGAHAGAAVIPLRGVSPVTLGPLRADGTL